jgi:hypothetical protein
MFRTWLGPELCYYEIGAHFVDEILRGEWKSSGAESWKRKKGEIEDDVTL